MSTRAWAATSGATFRAVSLPVFAGLLIRAIPVLTADFPLNDGGLFYAMTRDLQRANFLLPATTTYNGLDIPFAYPPLGFYLAGILSSAGGISLLDLFRFLPMVISTLTIPVVYLVGRELLRSRFQALIATWAFAFLPRGFDWAIAGGGLTRSLGLLMAFLAILEGVRFYRTGRRRHGAGLAVFAALTALSHPEAALFAGLSMVLLLLAFARTRRALRDSIVLAIGAAVIASPWWVTVVLAHGVGPFLSGGQTGSDLLSSFQALTTFTFTDEPFSAFLAVVGLIGLLQQVGLRRYLLPAWVVVPLVVEPRGAAAGVMLPLAMLIAIAVDEVLLARVNRLSTASDPDRLWPSAIVRDRSARILLVAALLLGIIDGVKSPTAIQSPLHALGDPEREAMAWIATNAPASADFLVVSGSNWFLDVNSEWFPVLIGRRSLATLQGYEWLGKAAWDRQASRYHQLQMCAFGTASCIDKWLQDGGIENAWLFVPAHTIDSFSPTGDCCAPLRDLLRTSPAYDVVYSGPGGAVFRPKG